MGKKGLRGLRRREREREREGFVVGFEREKGRKEREIGGGHGREKEFGKEEEIKRENF